MQRLHFLRNRIAHHEPIHQRDLAHDDRDISTLVGWICADTGAWLANASRTKEVLDRRPSTIS